MQRAAKRADGRSLSPPVAEQGALRSGSPGFTTLI